MDYLIHELSNLTGITKRTIRYYDQIGLLSPSYSTESGYRKYSEKEVSILQQILLFKEIGYELSEIKKIIETNDFSIIESLYSHLNSLLTKKDRLETLIDTVVKTISNIESGDRMNDNQKFEGFKDQLIKDNDEKYGNELKEKYDPKTINESYKKIKKMSKYEYEQTKLLGEKVNHTISKALATGNPASKLAQEACELHKEWIMKYWPSYSKEAHLGLAEMYCNDERFKKYYEKIGVGATKFLYEAIKIFTKKNSKS